MLSIDKLLNSNASFIETLLKEYIRNAKQDFFISGQFRFLIEKNSISLGLIDLFNFKDRLVKID